MKTNLQRLLAIGLLTSAWLATPRLAAGHCDTMDGPVVMDAKAALEKRDLTPALKWIKSERETELKTAFAQTLTVRTLGPDARKLADHYFFETLVRLHRQGEGAPYAGLKPAGAKVDPGIEAADQALESGNVSALIKTVTDEVAAGIRKRFTLAMEKKRHAGHNVEAGRDYVAAYVDFVHYVEELHTTATNDSAVSHEHSEPGAHVHHALHDDSK
jgi:hypothetical protein